MRRRRFPSSRPGDVCLPGILREERTEQSRKDGRASSSFRYSGTHTHPLQLRVRTPFFRRKKYSATQLLPPPNQKIALSKRPEFALARREQFFFFDNFSTLGNPFTVRFRPMLIAYIGPTTIICTTGCILFVASVCW